VKNLLTVDYQQSSSSLGIFPYKPLLANQKNSCCSIKIEYYQLPPHLVPEHIPLQNAIIIFHQPTKNIEWQLGESRKTERIET
jgi:hypothetical protein